MRQLVLLAAIALFAACGSPVASQPPPQCPSCEANTRCDLATATCVPLTCADVTCAGSEACVSGRCYPRDCATALCGDGRLCAESVCTEISCIGVSCPSSQACRGGKCFPVDEVKKCVTSADCAEGLACRNEQCTATPCSALAQCSAGEICTSAACTAGTISATTSSVTVTPSTGIAADGVAAADVVISIRDDRGRAVAGATSQLAASGTGNTLSQPGPSGADGVASAKVRSSVAGSKTLTVTVGSVALAPKSALFVAGPTSSATSTSTAGAAAIADGIASIPVSVLLKDASGNPIAGRAVTLTLSGAALSGSRVNGGAAGATTSTLAATDAAGAAAGAITSTVPGALQIVVSDTTVTLAPALLLQFTPAPPSAARSSVTFGSNSTTVANGVAALSLSITMADGQGNLLAGRKATINVSGTALAGVAVDGKPAGTSTLTTTAASSAAGTLAVFVGSTRAGSATFSVVVDGVTLGSASGTFLVGAVADANASFGASSTASTDSGALVLSMKLVDASGNPVAGKKVTFTLSGASASGASLDGSAAGTATVTSTATSAADGTLTVTVSSTRAGLLNLGLAVDGNALGGVSATFTPGAVDAARSSASFGSSSSVVGGTLTLTITLADRNGNLIPGKTASLALSGTASTGVSINGGAAGATPVTSAASGANGAISVGVSSSKSGSATLTLTAGGVLLAQTPTATFTAGPVSPTLSTLSTDKTKVANDGVAFATVTVTLVDAAGNRIAGHQVALSATTGAVKIDGTQASGFVTLSGVSSAAGTLTARLTSTFSVSSDVQARDVTEGVLLNPIVTLSFEQLPQINSLSPLRGKPGDSIVIDGLAFDADPTKDVVTFNGVVSPSVTILNDFGLRKRLLVTVPTSTSGPVVLTVNGVVASGDYTFVYPNVQPMAAGPRSSVVDSTGKLHVVYLFGQSFIHRIYTGATTFTETTIVTVDAGHRLYSTSGRFRLGLGKNDAIYMFYVQEIFPYSSTGDGGEVFFTKYLPASGWITPVNLNSTLLTGDSAPNSKGWDCGMDLVVDANDKLHLALNHWGSSSDRHVDYYTFDTAGTMTFRIVAVLHDAQTCRAQLAVDGDNTLHLTYDSLSTNQPIYYRSSTNGGVTWSAEEIIGNKLGYDSQYGLLVSGTGSSKRIYFSLLDASSPAQVKVLSRASAGSWTTEVTTSDAHVHSASWLWEENGQLQLYWLAPGATAFQALHRITRSGAVWGALQDLTSLAAPRDLVGPLGAAMRVAPNQTSSVGLDLPYIHRDGNYGDDWAFSIYRE